MPTVSQFLSSIGVNTHMDATRSPYGNVAMVEKDLAYIGVSTVRDHAWDTDLPAYEALAAKGIKFDLIVDGSAAESVAAMVPIKSSIVSFEGANEVDIWPVTFPGVQGQVAAAVAEQAALYTAVKSSPVFHNVTVLNESIGDSDHYAKYAAAAAYSDVTTIHAYAAWGDTPTIAMPGTIQPEIDASKPTVVSETGYFTMLNNTIDPSGVTEIVQAKYTLDTLFDDFAMGVSETYLYELLDEGADPGNTNAELHYGLFHANGTPKIAATALHNLNAILQTAGAVADPAVTLTPSFSGLPGTGETLQLTGTDGSDFIAVWAEPTIWNTNTQAAIAAPTTQVTVSLGKVVASVEVFDPLSGTKPIATYTDISKLVLGITDHPLIIQASGVDPLPSTFAALDAAADTPGSTVIDGSSGTVLTGSATKTDSFFVDTLGTSAINRTIVNFHKGDTLTLWGFVKGVGTTSWHAGQTNGTVSDTLTAGLDGAAGPTAKLTLVGFSASDVTSKIHVTTASLNGTPYLRLTDIA